MSTEVVMVLGRSVFIRVSGVWQCEQFEYGADTNLRLCGHLREMDSINPSQRVILIFEPEGMSHENVEMPNVDRSVFASLARIRGNHSVVSSLNMGWGIEWPEPSTRGVYTTLLHAELSPGLVHINDSCDRSCRRLHKAWALYTVIEALLKTKTMAGKARYCVVFTSGFTAIADYGAGRRLFRSWVGKMSERGWKNLWILMNNGDETSATAGAETEYNGHEIIVVSDGEPKHICPFWNELYRSGKVETVLGLDELHTAATKISGNHPGNLLEELPKPRELDRFLAICSAVSILTFGILGAAIISDLRLAKKTEKETRLRRVSQERELEKLRYNQREMLLLGKQMPDDKSMGVSDMHTEIMALANAVPESLLLKSIEVFDDGHVDMEAVVVDASFDSGSAKSSFSDYGLIFDPIKGWIYDVAGRSLKIQGSYVDHRP